MTPDHDAEHQFVRLLMQERAEREARWGKVKNSALGWITIHVLAGVGYVGYRILQHLVEKFAPEYIQEWFKQ